LTRRPPGNHRLDREVGLGRSERSKRPGRSGFSGPDQFLAAGAPQRVSVEDQTRRLLGYRHDQAESLVVIRADAGIGYEADNNLRLFNWSQQLPLVQVRRGGSVTDPFGTTWSERASDDLPELEPPFSTITSSATSPP